MGMALYEKPLKVELQNHELFVNGTRYPRSVRTVKDMGKTLMSTSRLEERNSFDVYYMYRGIVVHSGIRFDITVMPPGPVGEEYPKTHGHYHPMSSEGIAFPEVYQVLHGKCTILMQKKNRSGSVDVIIIEAVTGDVVLIPPEFGHVTINTGKDDLVMSNLVYDKFESNYGDFEANKGAAYYFLKNGEVLQNTNYFVNSSERLDPQTLNSRYGFSCEDLLSEFNLDPGRFLFLEKPGLLKKQA
jgi:glucose-6-phosphate isomerase